MRTAFILGASAVVLLPLACATSHDAQCPTTAVAAPLPSAPPAPAQEPTPKTANPLLEKWVGPYGGVPPFAKVKVDQFRPALEAAMDENRKEIAAIAGEGAPPTFENTIAAMEDSGRTFNDVQTMFAIWASTMNDA